MFTIPTLQDLVERTRRSFRAELPGTDAWLWPNNIGPTAKVIAGAMHELFGRLDHVQRQKFALTAEGEWLDRHGQEIGLSRRGAIPAAGLVTVTATGPGDVIAGAVLTRSDGVAYVAATGASFVTAGIATISVTAEVSGAASGAESGTPLTALSGVSGSLAFAVATDGLSGGADIEDDETFRARILFRKRNPPHGGAPADYVLWATEQPGVTRVFVERTFAGPGTVRVFVMMDDARPGGIPTPTDIARIRDGIEALHPAGAALTVSAPTPVSIPVTVSGLTPDTPQVRDAVRAALAGVVRQRGRVAGGNSSVRGMDYLSTPFVFSRSWLWQAVSNATGEASHAIVAPAGDIPVPPGSAPVLGPVNFVP